jgi:hypothetical protein
VHTLHLQVLDQKTQTKDLIRQQKKVLLADLDRLCLKAFEQLDLQTLNKQ